MTKKHITLPLITLLFGFAFTQPTFALTQNEPIHGFVAVGTFISNDYEGSDDYEVNPAIVARFQYKHYYLQTEGLGAKINISSYKNIEFGPLLNYRTGRDDDVESEAVSQIQEIDNAFEVGFFIRGQKSNAFAGGDEIGFEIKSLNDLSNTHEGVLATLSADYSYQVSTKLRLSISVETTYADNNYMQTYFGVNSPNSNNSGLPNFDAHEGIKDTSIGLMLNYQFNEKWGVISILNYSQLIGDAKDSPLVEIEGSDRQWFGLTGISYRF